MGRPQHRHSSRRLIIEEEEDYDDDIDLQQVTERENPDEKFISQVIDKLSFPDPQKLTNLKRQPVVYHFDLSDPNVHQLNLLASPQQLRHNLNNV